MMSFLCHPPEEVSSAMQELDPYRRLLDLFYCHFRKGVRSKQNLRLQ